MASKRKRLKTSRASKDVQVIIFNLPDHKPDLRFKVFNVAEFHVHSGLLNMHSAFFGKFLDSPDKTPNAPSAPFRYEWVSKVDDNDLKEWSLVAARPDINLDEQNQRFKGMPDVEYQGLQNLLCAIYGRPLTWPLSKDRLLLMIKMADCYCCLEVISRSLSTWIRTDAGGFGQHLTHSIATDLISAAVKLRHKELLSDCITHILAPWEAKFDAGMFELEPKVIDVITKARKSIECRMAHIQMGIMALKVKFPDFKSVFDSAEPDILKGCTTEHYFSWPKYYYLVDKCFMNIDLGIDRNLDPEAFLILDGLLPLIRCSRLHFDKTAVSGVGRWENYFLCVELEDEDLPWDTKEVDW